MIFNPNFKFINYSTIISDLHKKYGVGYINSKEFADIIANNSAELLLKFLFLIAYETQDAFEDTIADELGFCIKIRELLDSTWEKLSKTEEERFIYRISKSFTYQFKVLPTKDDLAKYVKINDFDAIRGESACKEHVFNLKKAIVEMQLAGYAPANNIFLTEMLEFERNQMIRLLIGILQDGQTPDIDSVILFSDQLDNDTWWNDVAKLTWQYVQNKNKAGV